MQQQDVSMRKVIISCMIGNALEWYDFALYGFFVTILARHFFPSQDPVAAIIAAYGAFAVAFILRPVGALLLGYIGDKFGRKQALILSLYLMALPTVLMGLLPTYAVIGIMAPILLTFLRFLQGFSMGGEFTGSMIFIAEHAPMHQRGFMSSFAPCSVFIGIIVGSGLASLLTVVLSTAVLESWGWRIPFLIGALGAVVGIYMRRHLTETETFQQMKAAAHTQHMPLKQLWQGHWQTILLILMVDCGIAVGGFFIITFMTTYMIQFYQFPTNVALMITTINLGIAIIGVIFFGWLNDKIKAQWIMLSGCVGLVLFAYPLFQLFRHGFVAAGFAKACIVLFFTATFGPLPALLMQLFPPNVRYTGMSFAHNLAMALFGGAAPMIATILIGKTQNLAVPGIYFAATMFVSMIGIALTLKHRIYR